jgi:5-methyltetrahydrofolate--homocysteine methyltransferase
MYNYTILQRRNSIHPWSPGIPMEPILQKIYDGILNGDAQPVSQAVQHALDSGIAPDRILEQAMVHAMREVGRLFSEGQYFVPEMLIAARAMKKGLAVLKPYMVPAVFEPIGRVVIGSVKGDVHDIGKNLVGMMLEGVGFEINDLGTDVSPAKFVSAVKAGDVQILALSALLTTTMPSMKSTIEALKSAGLRDKVKVIIGGSSVNETYARQIGADGYGPDAASAVKLARTLVGR